MFSFNPLEQKRRKTHDQIHSKIYVNKKLVLMYKNTYFNDALFKITVAKKRNEKKRDIQIHLN